MRGSQQLRVGFRCDVGVETGVGHLVRCVALAEELVHRGVEVVFLSNLGGVVWAERQLTVRSLPIAEPATTAADLAAQAHTLGLDAVVLDGYHLDPQAGRALRQWALVVLDVVDDEYGWQEADLYLDQNLHAERRSFTMPSGAARLAGARYAVLRDVVRAERPAVPRPPRIEPAILDVLAFFGGTDAFGAAPVVVPLILQTGAAARVKVVASRPEVSARLSAMPVSADQRVDVLEPTEELPRLAATSDLVVTACGTSVWELLCVGAPSAVVAVSDNQKTGYRALLDEQVAAGLGRIDDLRGDSDAQTRAVGELAGLLQNPGRRAELSALGWALVDGRGRERVADALLDRVDPA